MAPEGPWAQVLPDLWSKSVLGRTPPPQEPSPLKDHLHAKFHPDLSSGSDFCREQTHTQTNIALYILD